ncbi:hypothetical protein [Telluribacter sp. SYSU D00476]|uniref:hypothetical protein n=1 Tax=Telluribacter sp. SYSU D00476 TaxID=2811430 RepID=UPI001FF3D77F|nr:hypothetical protein [Telluribacter sp. SYSU D00476]
MTKGHNKGTNNEQQSKEDVKHVQGQDNHLKHKDREKGSSSRSGRSADDDPSGGTKGGNAV